MSVLYTCNYGWVLSHEEYINRIYENVRCEDSFTTYKIKKDLFKIEQPYKLTKYEYKSSQKRIHEVVETDTDSKFQSLHTTVDYVQRLYKLIYEETKHLFNCPNESLTGNLEALKISKTVYDETSKVCPNDAVGGNLNSAVRISLNNENFIFPNNCKFFCKDVAYIENYLNDIEYDLILLDPPWWNKYVRRKKLKTDHGYKMMYNNDLKVIPIEKMLSNDGLLVVWCTNSPQHLEALQNQLFRHWNVSLVAKLYWLKVTKNGKPVCDFSIPPNKQPFEQILIASKNANHKIKTAKEKLIITIPSALHSHKPPLLELFKPYLPSESRNLELFARYLLPNCTSWGLEAVRFQHESLYIKQRD